MHRYLLVLDMDLLAMNEEHDLEPINYLIAKQEQEPCEVVVLSLVDTSQTKLPATELLLGAQVGKFPVAPRPGHDIAAAAEHRRPAACCGGQRPWRRRDLMLPGPARRYRRSRPE
jgi:endonuclease/exonuclease/phosphatase (EEP) superfamily protein YafD